MHGVLVVRLVISVIAQSALLGALVLACAGTIHWARGWAFIAANVVASAITIALLLPKHRAVLEERMRAPVRADQPASDRVVSAALVAAVLASIAAAPLDRFRFHLLPEPANAIALLGAGLWALGWSWMALAMRDNPFAATVVRLQKERGHAVARTGVYAIVRHPMYAGAIVWLIGTALALGSYAAALFVAAPATILVVRIAIEERFLRSALPGYEEYTRVVRYRLVPGVW